MAGCFIWICQGKIEEKRSLDEYGNRNLMGYV